MPRGNRLINNKNLNPALDLSSKNGTEMLLRN